MVKKTECFWFICGARRLQEDESWRMVNFCFSENILRRILETQWMRLMSIWCWRWREVTVRWSVWFLFSEYFWRCEWIKSRKRYCWVISMSSYGRHSDVKVIACGRHGGWCWDTCRRHYDDVLHYVKDGWGTENSILKVLYIFTGVKSKIKMMRNSEKGSGWWRFLAFVIGNLLFDFVLIGVVWGFRPLSLSIRCWGGRWRWLGQLWWLAKGFPVPTFSKARARVLRF